MVQVNRREIVDTLGSLRQELAARFKVTSIGMFGSVARNEQSSTSDVDLLVEFEESADLFDFVGAAQYIEEALGFKVDLVPARALRAELKAPVEQELIRI
ncbi:MAG: nucleotidyltransferase [Chitinivibrionales bacterium]|nr:nucleotidyltransferase [Chitinivibrionales bacterium]